jgi:hypothetical protein
MPKRRYSYNPTGIDAWEPKDHHPAPGTHVVLSGQSGVGQLRGASRYVEDAADGRFYGMVNRASLKKVTVKNPVPEPHPEEAARVQGVVRDRRG